MATRTKAQERADAAVAYNAFLAGCPSRQLLDRIADKWVVLVVCALGGGAGDGTPRALRYSELSRSLAGVSQKMLTQTVRSLERDGLLTRTVTATVPATVTYELTDLGVSLHRLTQDLRVWAQDNMGAVAAHRDQHDARSVAGSGAAG